MGFKFIWDFVGAKSQTDRAMIEKAQVIAEQQKAVWEFMAINQHKINYDSEGNFEYKHLSCSTAAMGVGAMLASKTEYKIKSTNMEYRNILNAPDEFEVKGIARFKDNPSASEYWAIEKVNGEQVFRYMTPLEIDENCLDCHGEPRGEIDISGHPKEGLGVGDFAGALSLIMPMDIYYDNIRKSVFSNGFFLIILILVCILSMYFLMAKMVINPLGELERAVAQVGQGKWNINLSNLRTKGEIRRLTRHFQNMTGQLQDLYSNLELRVAERTNELKEANLILRKQQQELEQVNRRLQETNVYKSEFLAVMSHELRTPLTSIIAFTELMLMEITPEEKDQRQYLEEVLQNSQILLRLINNILDLAKIEAGKDRLTLEVIDIADIIASVESTIAPLARNQGLLFCIQIAPNVPLTKADPEKMRRVIENLAGNAVKFTEKGGKVEIMVEYDTEAGEILISVSDTGVGIREEHQKIIFDKFTQADSSPSRKHGGTGLGLSLAKELIELHQGWIKVQSRYGGGSTFIVGLPVKPVE
ncbi:MAG TPA: DUF3365 domain-containing protein [Clostridia bacterium]|nr:DUF3365 domain-containing protein [Clostridia bacterium]